MRIWNWQFDALASEGYNRVNALEVALINLGIVDYKKQWSIDDAEGFARNYDNFSEYRITRSASDADGDFTIDDDEYKHRVELFDIESRGFRTKFGDDK